MQTKYQTTTVQMSVHLENESPIFGGSAINVRLEDEAGGIFLELIDGEGTKMRVDYTQWIELNKGVAAMMKQKCQGI